MSNNFIISRPSSNGKLLSLLTNRQRAKSVPNLRNDWPGKVCPNFALTARVPRTPGQNTALKSRKSLQTLNPNINNDLPSVRIPLSGKLELIPWKSERGGFIRGVTSTSRKNLTHGSSRKQTAIIKIQQNEDAKSVSSIFKNSKIIKKVTEVIDSEMNKTTRENNFKQNWQNTLKKKSLIALSNGDKRAKSKGSQRKQPEKKQMGKQFKIDYLAFGYIEKVIDNPQLWGRFVHKIEENGNDVYITE